MYVSYDKSFNIFTQKLECFELKSFVDKHFKILNNLQYVIVFTLYIVRNYNEIQLILINIVYLNKRSFIL